MTQEVRSAMEAVSDVVVGWYQGIVDNKGGWAPYIRGLLAAILLSIVFSGAFFAYRWYTSYRESAAAAQFVEVLKAHRQAMRGDAEAWSRLALLCRLGRDQHSGSYLVPFYYMFEAEALFQKRETTAAVALMEKAVESISSRVSLASLIRIKLGIMLLDQGTDEARGVSLLREIAEDQSDLSRDTALYYLGRYFWVKGMIPEAKKYWQDLRELQQGDHVAPSPWAPYIQPLLEQVAFL